MAQVKVFICYGNKFKLMQFAVLSIHRIIWPCLIITNFLKLQRPLFVKFEKKRMNSYLLNSALLRHLDYLILIFSILSNLEKNYRVEVFTTIGENFETFNFKFKVNKHFYLCCYLWLCFYRRQILGYVKVPLPWPGFIPGPRLPVPGLFSK